MVVVDGFLPGFVVVVVDEVLELVLEPSGGGFVGSVAPDGVVTAGRDVNAFAGAAKTTALKATIATQSGARPIPLLNFRPRKSNPNCVASLDQMPRRVTMDRLAAHLPEMIPGRARFTWCFPLRRLHFDHRTPRSSAAAAADLSEARGQDLHG